MIARASLFSVLGALALLATACNKGEEASTKDGKDGKDAKLDGKAKGDGKADGAEVGEPTLKVDEGDAGAEGPVPPQTSMVFFQVEGVLIPLACFDKDKGTLAAGTGCLDLVPAGADVRVSGGDQAFNKKVGERAEPTCLSGTGSKVGLSADSLTGGAEFTHGTWPPSALKIVTLVPEDSTSPAATQLDDDTTAKLAKAVPHKGKLTAQQVTEIDVDGNDKKDGIYSVFVPHPSIAEQYGWSGVFLAPDGNLDALVLLAKSASHKDVFEVLGTLNVDGAGNRELWIRMVYAEGAGEAVFTFDGKEAKPLGKWSCGA
jgi:hypothetical protein